MGTHESAGVVPPENWHHFRVELAGGTETEMWVSGEDTVVDAQRVARERAQSFHETATVKFCHEGYHGTCDGD